MQLEEEEYTARIIHYFNLGLLELPPNVTLRTYISKKLRCVLSLCFLTHGRSLAVCLLCKFLTT